MIYLFWFQEFVITKKNDYFQESTVTQIVISESENFIAFVTNKGIICVLELNENTLGKLVTRSEDLCDSEITALCWTNDNKPTLYVGDSSGRVFFLKLSFLVSNANSLV